MERNNRPGSPALRKPVGAVHRQETVSGRNGFVKYHVHAEMIRGDIDRLCAAGVPLGRITVGADCMTVVERLRAGERLEVCSLGDVCTSVSGLLRVLHAVASRGASLHSQSDPWLDMEAKGCNWTDLVGGIYVPVDFRAYERGASPMQTFGAVGRAPQRHPARAAQALPGRSDALPEFRHERARYLRGKRSRGAQFLPLYEKRGDSA